MVSPTAGRQEVRIKQLNEGLRTKNDELPFDETLEPFFHGVASGDPLSDRVVIWTKVTPEEAGAVEVTWVVTTDASLENEVRRGIFTTNAGRDYTVKIDVDGLQPATTYYYNFYALGRTP